MRLSMSEKKGMTSAMMNAKIHVVATMAAHEPQATNEFEWRCSELRKRRKNTKRELTDCEQKPVSL